MNETDGLQAACRDTALLIERGIIASYRSVTIACAQKWNWLRIARQSMDSYFALRNSRIAQIPGSRGTLYLQVVVLASLAQLLELARCARSVQIQIKHVMCM